MCGKSQAPLRMVQVWTGFLGMCTYGMFTEKTLKDLEHTIMYIDPVSISTRYTHNFYSLIRFVPKVSISKLSLKKN